MNVLLISLRSDIGGGPQQMWTLANNIKANFYCALPEDGIYFDRFERLLGKDHIFKIPHRKFNFLSLIKLHAFCRQNNIDLIHSHGKGAGLYSRLLALFFDYKVIHTLHGFHDGMYGFVSKRLYWMYERFLLIFTKVIICVSPSEAKIFKNRVCETTKTLVVLNGTEVQRDIKLGVNVNKRKIVSIVARLTYQKNISEVIAIAKAMPDYDFFIYGDGEEKAFLSSLVKESSIVNVRLMGEATNILERIKNSDLFLSTSRWEGLPLAPLEAMSLGLPLVLSNVPGNSDVVLTGVNGYLYELGDVNDCVSKIMAAVKLDKDAILKTHEESFSANIMCNKTYESYQKVIYQ